MSDLWSKFKVPILIAAFVIASNVANFFITSHAYKEIGKAEEDQLWTVNVANAPIKHDTIELPPVVLPRDTEYVEVHAPIPASIEQGDTTISRSEFHLLADDWMANLPIAGYQFARVTVHPRSHDVEFVGQQKPDTVRTVQITVTKSVLVPCNESTWWRVPAGFVVGLATCWFVEHEIVR